MSRIVKRISRDVILATVNQNHVAAKNLEAIANVCINVIPQAVQTVALANGSTADINYLQAGEYYSVWLICSNNANNVTINLPPASGLNAALPMQEVTITTNGNITALTLQCFSGIVVNNITSLAAGKTAQLKYNGGAWYRLL